MVRLEKEITIALGWALIFRFLWGLKKISNRRKDSGKIWIEGLIGRKPQYKQIT